MHMQDVQLRRDRRTKKDSERTYADATRLWRERGCAPKRLTLQKAFFARPDSVAKKLNFEGATVYYRDPMIDEHDGVLREAAVFMDERCVVYFLPRDEVGNDVVDGYFLIYSAHNEDRLQPDPDAVLYEIPYDKIKEHDAANAPQPVQRSRRRTHQLTMEKRYKRFGWNALYRELSSSATARRLDLSRRGFQSKKRLTTGHITFEKT